MKKIIVLITIMAMIMGTTISVNADTYSDWKTTGTINGYKYKYRSGLMTYTDCVQGRAHAESVNKTVPAKYIGGRSYIYNKYGALIAASDWAYNKKAVVGVDFNGKTVSTPGSYYCIAKFKFKKNTNSYSGVYKGKATKCVVLKNSKTKATIGSSVDSDIKTIASSISKSKEGVTYGSGLREYSNNEMPDMILAVGVKGKTGYIDTDDLSMTNKSTKLDGVVLASGESSSRSIPVYSLDGEMVDRFQIFTSCEKE